MAPSRPVAWRLLTGLLAGAATGLFLGDEARVFQPVADGFVKLLQMAVLPYVTVSIIGSVGALDMSVLRRLGMRAALVLLSLWMLALAFAFAMPLVFPPSQSACNPALFKYRQDIHDFVDTFVEDWTRRLRGSAGPPRDRRRRMPTINTSSGPSASSSDPDAGLPQSPGDR